MQKPVATILSLSHSLAPVVAVQRGLGAFSVFQPCVNFPRPSATFALATVASILSDSVEDHTQILRLLLNPTLLHTSSDFETIQLSKHSKIPISFHEACHSVSKVPSTTTLNQ